MNETTQNFLDVWKTLDPWEPPQVFFRLYYDDQGRPIEYSMEDKPGKYVDITAEQYQQQLRNVRVISGQLTVIDTNKITQKLVPSSTGTPCDPRDVCIVNSKSNTKWSLKTYE